jgi:hypothetical protein
MRHSWRHRLQQININAILRRSTLITDRIELKQLTAQYKPQAKRHTISKI